MTSICRNFATIIVIACANVPAYAQDEEIELQDAVELVQIDVMQAIETAAKKTRGTVVNVELAAWTRGQRSHVVFKLTTLTKRHKVKHIEIDARSGKVLEVDDYDGKPARRALQRYRDALTKTAKSLQALTRSAAAIVRGKVCMAEIGAGSKGPECEILIANGDYMIAMRLNAKTGRLIELELAED